MRINVLHVSDSDNGGGASIAAYRIHRSFSISTKIHSVSSRMHVAQKRSADDSITATKKLRVTNQIKSWLRRRLGRQYRTSNSAHSSVAFGSPFFFNELKAICSNQFVDIINLHWLGDQTLSIEDISRISLPLVWTLHDQWPYCGSEHYVCPPRSDETESSDKRYELAYSHNSRPRDESGFDINRRTYLRKQRSWRHPISLICPSRWMAECASRSSLMNAWPINVIPNPIDTKHWLPLGRQQSRSILGLPQHKTLLLFGAMGAVTDPRKGIDLLLQALQRLNRHLDYEYLEDIEIVLFGQASSSIEESISFPVHSFGVLNDELSLRLLYSAVDCFVLSSRLDNLPNTGLEAHACGLPIVAFRTGGIVDIVDDGITGLLADPFSPDSLANAIETIVTNPDMRNNFSISARYRAQSLWSPTTVSAQYSEVYAQCIDSWLSVSR